MNASEIIRPRLYLVIYFIIILLVSLYLIINFWTPGSISTKIESNTMPNITVVNATKIPARIPVNITKDNAIKIIVPTSGPADKASEHENITLPIVTQDNNITTKITTLQNSTTETIRTEMFIAFKNGTKQILKDNLTSETKATRALWEFAFLQLDSTNPEIRLVSVSILFGVLGACISGITSVLTRKLWDTGKYVRSRRLIHIYFARPWVGAAVALVTYVTLRAGLINMGNATVISEFGIAAISALVGLMSDEMIFRLRDVFRTFFGIPSLQETQELILSLPKNEIHPNDIIAISATLPDLRSTNDLYAYFFVQDASIVELIKKEDKFNSSGVAIVTIKGKNEGKTSVTVMVKGDINLYDSGEIGVGKPGPEAQQDEPSESGLSS